MMEGSEFRIQGVGVQNSGCSGITRVQGSEFRIQGAKFRGYQDPTAPATRARETEQRVHGYLAHNKQPLPKDHHRALGIVLL